MYTRTAWNSHMDDGGTVLDLTFTLWAHACQHTSAGANHAHRVRDSHGRVENKAQSKDSQRGPRCRSCRVQSNVRESY